MDRPSGPGVDAEPPVSSPAVTPPSGAGGSGGAGGAGAGSAAPEDGATTRARLQRRLQQRADAIGVPVAILTRQLSAKSQALLRTALGHEDHPPPESAARPRDPAALTVWLARAALAVKDGATPQPLSEAAIGLWASLHDGAPSVAPDLSLFNPSTGTVFPCHRVMAARLPLVAAKLPPTTAVHSASAATGTAIKVEVPATLTDSEVEGALASAYSAHGGVDTPLGRVTSSLVSHLVDCLASRGHTDCSVVVGEDRIAAHVVVLALGAPRLYDAVRGGRAVMPEKCVWLGADAPCAVVHVTTAP